MASKHDLAEYKRFENFSVIMMVWDAVIKLYLPMQTLRELFEDKFEKYADIIGLKLIRVGGLVMGKKEFRTLYIQDMMNISIKTKMYAKSIDDMELYEMFNFVTTDMVLTSDLLLYEAGKNVYDEVNPLVISGLLTPFRVTTEMMSDLETKNNDFKKHLDKIVEQKTGSVVQTTHKVELEKELIVLLKDILELSVEFKESKPKMYEQLKVASKYPMPIYGNESLRGVIYQSGEGKVLLTNAVISVLEADGEIRSRRSNEETAAYIFRNLKEGKVTITVKHSGHQEKVEVAYIVHNECTTLDINLEKV